MRSDPPELEALNAVLTVMRRKSQRIARPGFWRVFRDDGDRVVFETLSPANDVVSSPPPPMPPFVA